MVPKVSIIIVNWNGWKDTLECLESVYQIEYDLFDVIVFDNGSTDDSLENLRDQKSRITLLRSETNLGFASASNRAIEHALQNGAEYFLLLNNDTVVDSGVLQAFLATMNEFPDAGILGAKIYYYADRNRIWFAGGRWNDRISRFEHIGQGVLDDHQSYETSCEIDYATGCALFSKREVVETVGVMDPAFFAYYEESDWCYRARRYGYKTYYAPRALLWHKVSSSTGGAGSLTYSYYMTRNHLLWTRKNVPWIRRFKVYKNVLASFFDFTFHQKQFPLMKRFYWDLLELRKPHMKARLRGVRDYLLRYYGEYVR